MQKYFYLVIKATKIEQWLDKNGNYCSWLMKTPGPKVGGYKTRAQARGVRRVHQGGEIHQFENKPPYKYIKKVK